MSLLKIKRYFSRSGLKMQRSYLLNQFLTHYSSLQEILTFIKAVNHSFITLIEVFHLN